MIIEGCYIPFDWKKDFSDEYLKDIQYYCLIMTKEYIEKYFEDIKKYANVIEQRLDDTYCTAELLIKDNEENLQMCKKYGCNYILIDREYEVII